MNRCGKKEGFYDFVQTSKTRFCKLPAAKVFLGLSKIEGKGKLAKAKDL